MCQFALRLKERCANEDGAQAVPERLQSAEVPLDSGVRSGLESKAHPREQEQNRETQNRPEQDQERVQGTLTPLRQIELNSRGRSA